MEKKKRNANIELLRIVAMLMVVSLHYINKGGAISPYDDFSFNAIFVRIVEELCLVAVNIYVLISGYYLVNSTFRFEKVIKLWIQVFFYSAGIYFVFYIMGVLPDIYNTKYYRLQALLPITSQHYWFVSIYLFMFLLFPFLRVIAKNITKKQYQMFVLILLCLFSRTWKIILPESTPIDDRGYGILWFITLFFIASYLRLYGDTIKGKKRFLLIYVVASVMTLVTIFSIGKVSSMLGRFANLVYCFEEYNAPFTIVASISLFLFFTRIDIKNEKIAHAINKISSCTLGVYLIHEHFLLRNFWADVLKVYVKKTEPTFIIHFFLSVLVVFAACSFIDYLRGKLFNFVFNRQRISEAFEKCSFIDKYFNC